MIPHSLHEAIQRLAPSLWPLLWAHCLAGFVAANGPGTMNLPLTTWLKGILAAGVWAVLLGGGGAAVTSFFAENARERAEAAPRASSGDGTVASVAVALILLGLASAPAVGWDFFDAYLVGIVLVVMYAAPPVQLADAGWGAVACEALGCGALSFYAGYVASEPPAADSWTLPCFLLGFACLFAAMRICVRHAASRIHAIAYWILLSAGTAALAGAVLAAGGRFTLALLIVPLAAWLLGGIRRYDSDLDESDVLPFLMAAWVLTDVAVILSALLR